MGDAPAPRPWTNGKHQTDAVAAAGAMAAPTRLPMPLGPILYSRGKLQNLQNQPIKPSRQADLGFGMVHLRLLHYFEHDVYEHTKEQYPTFNESVPYFMETALKTPYLMEQLLAYAAAHKSTVDPANRSWLLEEAMRLQTRALATYNSVEPQLSNETCLPMFLYSSLLAHHIVFDISTYMKNDLGAAIGWMTHSIAIHRGLMTMARAAWPWFLEEAKDVFSRACRREATPVPPSGITRNECQLLLARLRDSTTLKSPALDDLCLAVELLQDRFDATAASPGDMHSSWAVLQDYMASLPQGYVDILNKHEPEALVVLAYFAVLLHRAAEHWFVNNLGMRLVHLISEQLGSAWAEWLAWPRTETGITTQSAVASFGLLF